MSLNLSEAWKNIPAPQPEAEQAPSTHPVPEQETPLTPPIPPSGNPLFGNPFPAPGDLLRTPPALSSPPQTLKSIFDSPRYPSGQSPANIHIAPPSSHIAPPPSSRLEALHAMLLARHGDPELNAALGKNPTLRAQAALFDGSLPAKAAAAEQILRETMGEKKAAEPGLYFLALQEKLPQVATRQEALAAVYDHYTGIIEQNYLDNKTRRAAWQANRDTLEKTVPQVVSGLITPDQLNNTLTPEQLSIYNKEFDPAAINKASAAFSILQKTFSSTPEEGLRNMVKQRTAMQITSILSDDNGNGTYAINEKAFALFETSLMRLMTDVQEQSGDKYKFLHNLRLALFAPIHKRSEDMRLMDASRQSAEQQGNAALAGNIAELFGWQRGQENADALLNHKTEELASLQQDWQQSRAANQQEARVLGLLSTGQDLGNQSGDNASFSAKVVNCLGSVAGQTAPFFFPYAGWGLAFSEAFDDKRNRAYYAGLQPGTSEWSAFIDAATSTAVEKISFGAIGKFSRLGWAINKLPGTSKLRSTLMGNFWGRILTETGSGIAEETFLEPTAEAVLQWTARNNIAHWIGLKVGGNYDGEKYLQELSGMLQPEQFMATAIFVAGLSSIQTPSIKRAVREYSRSVEMLMLQGMDKAEAQRIAAIENDEERQQAVNAAIKESGKNQKQRETNIAAGAAAFRSLAEVRATVESEAYKYYQQEMHLPHVEEKLDKPGFYTLTVLDKESGQKKFTQEMTEDQLVALFGQYFSADEKRRIHEAQSAFAANAFLRAAESTGELQSQDMLQWSGAESETAPDSPQPSSGQHPANSQIAPHPSSLIHQEVSSLGNMVRAIGSMNQQTFSYLTKLATQEFTRRTQAGMSEQEALSSPFAQLSPYVPLGTMMQLEQAFAARLNIAEETTGEEDLSTTRLFKMRTSPGTSPADTLFMLTRGHVGSREMLEDLFEWRLDHITQGAPSRLQAIGSLLRDTQTSLQKLGFTGQFIAPQGDLTPLKIVEAMSKLALSDTLANADTLPLPQWQKDLLQYHVNNLADAHYLLNLGHAYNEGRQKGNITQDMADILRDLGHQVRTVFNQATIEQQDIQAVKDARALVNKLDPTNTPTASEIQEQQQQDAEAEKNHISTSDQSKKITPPTTEQNPSPSPHRTSDLPPSLQQVFPGGASYNPAAQTWLGMVPVDKLHLSPEVPQVKVNSGKKGVVNPLVGDYRSDAPPIYVWKRSNGRLEVVSGRHRLDLAQRTGTKTIAAYVYEEDATHDTQWARLLDYEQNMQDDQADELTAAIYVRETSLTDDELTRRGLTRSGTKSRRGLLIGREAREDLWTRFKSGAIKAQDAEAICQLTRYIQDKTRIDAMQLTAANDLANGKPLDFIAAKIQLMAHAAADGLTQSLISFGESFEADMERAAEYVSRCIGIINDHINAIKGVRTISKKGSVLETEGITAGLSADPAERLRELELLKAMYEKIGLYENLRIRALTWDEKTPPDPIGDHRLEMLAERARAEEAAAAVQEEEDRKAAEALTPGLGFSLTPSRSPKSTFPALWKQAAKELNILGSTSFALNGSRVAIHTISEDKFRQALELGGMPNPAVQIADIQSGPVHYAEIGAILHPDLIDPAKTPGARIWQGDTWTRMMPEKITEEGDSWDNEEHTEEDIPWFYDAYGDLVEWNRDNLDQHMKAKHLGSFLPHDIPTDEVLDNYGEEGGAFPLILASQAYAVEFDSIRQAAENDNNTLQIDRLAAEQASNELQKQFHNLLSAYYLEPRSLQKFLMEYWREDATPETVAQALINEYLIDDPSDIYDEDTEEYADLKQSNESIAEEIADFITACRSSAKPYYEAAHGGWLSPSDFTGFIIPSHLEETLRPQLEQRGLPVYTYDLTEEDAALLNNPWRVAKTPWIKDAIDERRNDALRDFLEDHDVSFSLTPGDNPQESNIVPRPSYMQLGLRPTALAAAWHEVEQSAPVTIPISPDTKSDQQGYSKLARKSFISLRTKTRQQDTLPRQSIRRREELDKPFLRTADNRTIYLGEKDWSRFITSSPHARTLTAMGALEPLIATARYLHTAPEFNPGSANQIKARHYYLGKVNDPIHGTSLVLLTLREDTRGTYLETLQTEETSSLGKKNGSASSQTDFGLTHRAAGRSLPAPTLHTIKQFVNFIDEQSQATNAFLAPNGQPTKLTPDQWLLTRTQPFLNYFGDWLHDPSSASVVLDPNGEPLVCHRGLKQHYNPGIRRNYTWVSSSRELSAEYASGGTVLDLFISARRPFRFPDGLTRQTSDQFRETLKTQLASEAELGNITSDQNQTAATTLDTLIHGDKETEAFKIWEHFKELKDILSDLGYDAVSTEENGVMTYGLFQPGQAKSSTTNYGTYDIARPDITFALTPEEKSIVQQAQTEGSWLAAPNGQTTRLTEKQWIQVRTKAFREWFGDWLHDPAHSSRVMDGNGEPLVVYHGTRKAGFTVFDNRAGAPSSHTPAGSAFFAASPPVASSYAGTQQDVDFHSSSPSPGIYPCFLNMRSPLEEDFEGDWWDNRGEPWYDLYDKTTQKDIPPPSGEEYWKSEQEARDYTSTHGITDYMLIRTSSSRTTDSVVQDAMELGRDGAIIRNVIDPGEYSDNEETDVYVALRPEQIKSATQNRGSFDPLDPNITFSLSNLAAVHSIAPDQLFAADQLGGLPLPSIAVTRLDKPYTWGGQENIYLVGSPSLADPTQGVEIHDRDMWSGVFPELKWNQREQKERDSLYKQTEEAALRYEGNTHSSRLHFFQAALAGSHRGELENKLRHTPHVHAVFAAERGYAPRPKTIKTPARLAIGDRRFWQEIQKMRPWKNANTLSPGRQQDFLAAMERTIDRFRQTSPGKEEQKTMLLHLMQEELREAKENNFINISSLALQDARYAGKTVPDQEANEQRFAAYVAKHQKAFDAWIKDKMERWFDPQPRLKDTGEKATLDNITQYMLGKKRISREKALTFSTGLLRAKRSRRFTSLDQIKKQRDTLTTTQEHKTSQENANSLIQQFQIALDRIVNHFSTYDNAVEALSRVKGAPTREKVAAALTWMYHGSPHVQTIRQSTSLLDLGVEALQSLKEELRDYFEGVPRRAVLLEEFTHAILPESLKMNQKLRQILKNHNIAPLFHDGTREGRTRAMSSLIGSTSSFSLTPGDSPQTSSNRPSSSSYINTPSSDFMASLTTEELSIAQNAMEAGDWLHAPNGQPTKLSPRQWLQVRTASFKHWFGDWQNASDHASRVVDGNGEPRIVYHGSRNAGFIIFDSTEGNIQSAAPPGSSFFAAHPQVAISYSNTEDEPNLHDPDSLEGIDSPPGLYPCFLNLREPLEEDFEGAWWDGTGQPLFEAYDNESDEFIQPPNGDDYWKSEEDLQEYLEAKGYTDYDIYDQEGSRTTNSVVDNAINMGLDGVIIRNVVDPGTYGGDFETDVYVALCPEQIKSATQNRGSFNPSNPDITFSVIGPHAETWDNYKNHAFTGRDEGKLRAEIDTSQARLLIERPERDMTSLLSLLKTFKDSVAEHQLTASPEMKLYRDALESEEYFRNSGADPAERDSLYRAILEEYGFDREAKLSSSSALANSIRELTAPCRQIHHALLDRLEKNPLTGKLIHASRNAPPVYRGLHESLLNFLTRGEDRFFLDALREAGAWKSYRMEDMLDYPELFAAYPSMRNINLVFQDQTPQNANGYLLQQNNSIVLQTPSPYVNSSLLLSTLLHEIQHVIQTIEGYDPGGSPSMALKLFFLPAKKKLHALKSYEDSLGALFAHLYQAYKIAQAGENPQEGTALHQRLRREGNTMTEERKKRLTIRFLEEELDQVRQRLHPEVPEGIPSSLRFPAEQIAIPTAQEVLEDGGQTLWKTITQMEKLRHPLLSAVKESELLWWNMVKQLEEMGGNFGAYQRLAGEIEARNVQHRMYWSESHRTQTPFNDTLEYPGEAITTFSLSSLKQIVSSLSTPSLQATRAAELIKDFDNAAENWRRVMSAKTDKPNARVGAELFGMINSLLSSARYVLPPGYRSRVHLQMQWASVYAAMAETGEIPPKGTLQSGDIFYQRFEESVVNDTTAASTPEEVRQIIVALGNQRLDRTMSKIFDRVRDQLVYFAKDQLYEKTMRRVEAVYPQKEPGKKSPRGRMEADAYRSLAQYRQMLVTSAEGKAEALAALGALYKEEQDEDKIQQYERDLLAWKTYGDYKGMSLPQAQNAMEKLLEYLLTNRNAWERKLETDRSRTKYTARRIARNLPEKNSGTSRARSRIDNRTRLRKCLIALPYSFMSYSHLMLALEPILGQRFSRARIQDITDANAALLNDSNDRAAWLSATIRHIAGLKTESQAEQWLVHFDTPQQTGITLNPEITITTKLTLEEAQDWIALTPEERTARRLEIKQRDERTETLTENVPQEEDIPLLQEALSDYLSRTDAQQNRQQVLSVERTAINAEAAGPLTCSRDCALYAILLHEQKDYADQYNEVGELIRKGFLRREGFDDDGIAALYEFVGSEGLEYGYALRKKLGEKGQTLAQVYEQRMGVPFTLKENYFRATFDRNSTREKDTLAEPQNSSIGSGKYGLLIDRILHAENLDYSKSATLVFLAASAEQDNYIYTSHITADWRALLRNKQLEQKLRQHLGEDIMGKLSAWMDLIDGASLENNRAFLHLSRMQGMLQRAFAISVLAGNGYVLLKQSTAILHGFFAGWIPSEILERADGSRELAHRHISFSNYLFHLAASQMGLGNIPLKTIAASPYFTARMRGEGHILAQIGNQMPGQQYSRLEKIPETAMNLIETVDVKANLHAMHALANAYYAKAKELNEKNDSPFTDAQLRQAAINQVGQSLELGAQPLTKTQKSMSQAAGGILSKLAFVMKSEQLNKIGLMAAQWKTGSTRNRVCAAQSWLALGITSSLLAWLINWIKGMDDEDDEKKWKKYAATALLGDLTTIPLAGEAVNSLTSLVTGERVFADSYARTLIDVGGITRAGKKEYAHLAGDKELDWDAHFNNLTALARFSGVGGIFSRSPSAVLSSYGALSLSAATGANISRTSKDLLTTLFRDPENDSDQKKKKRKIKPKHKTNENKS